MMVERFCIEVLTRDFGMAREAVLVTDQDSLAATLAEVVAISPYIACCVSQAPDDAPLTPELPGFLAGLKEHLRGPRVDLPNPTPDDPNGEQWAKLRALTVAQQIGGTAQAFPGFFAVYRNGDRQPALVVQYKSAEARN